MPDAYIIEVSTLTAGIVAVHGAKFRFYAAHPAMRSIDGQEFRSLKAARRAAESLALKPKSRPYRNRTEMAADRRRRDPDPGSE